MREMFDRAHILVVPIKTDFVEGFNRVVAEGILSGCPVITSAVCPALFYVREAVVEVPPDNIKGYGDALLIYVMTPSFMKTSNETAWRYKNNFMTLHAIGILRLNLSF